MSHSTDSDAEFEPINHARPHSRSSGAFTTRSQTPRSGCDHRQNAAPAGGLAISANDMSRWLLTQLGTADHR
jgi:hypothetical protein